MIIVTPVYNPATSSDVDLKHPLHLGWRNLSKTAEKVPPAHMQRWVYLAMDM
jgi:hypothetical protein